MLSRNNTNNAALSCDYTKPIVLSHNNTNISILSCDNIKPIVLLGKKNVP